MNEDVISNSEYVFIGVNDWNFSLVELSPF